MTIQITRPEIEALIQERLHSGVFESVDAKIERGLAQLDRGEGIPGEQLRARLQADRAAWLDRSGS